jgi:hypothetical protein
LTVRAKRKKTGLPVHDIDKHRLPPDQLRQLITQKWPEAVALTAGLSEPIFQTGIANFDALFPRQGIPYGQLIEITGEDGSGKTSFLFMILAALTKIGTVAYIDLSGSFFPAAAATCGVDIKELVVVRPDNLPSGLRAAELVLSKRVAHCIVLDLTNQKSDLSQRTDLSLSSLLHRLRQQTARSKALVIFLTENNNASHPIIPASTVALRLEVARLIHSKLKVTVIKSRISKEGAHVEIALNG